MQNKIYVLVGPHGSGKSALAEQLISMGLHFVPVYTTYDLEKSSSQNLYHHIAVQEFREQDFIVKSTYKGQYIGLRKDDVLSALHDHVISVTILEANCVKQLRRIIRDNLDVIYLMVDYVTLVDRMLRLNYTNNEIKYHLQYAENNREFDGWKTADYVVKNTHSLQAALNQIVFIMGLTTLVDEKKWTQLTK